jgi:hypothetical protein
MAVEEFVADVEGDALGDEILLLERHLRQTTGNVPRGTTSAIQATGDPKPARHLLDDAATRKLNGSKGNPGNSWRNPS